MSPACTRATRSANGGRRHRHHHQHHRHHHRHHNHCRRHRHRHAGGAIGRTGATRGLRFCAARSVVRCHRGMTRPPWRAARENRHGAGCVSERRFLVVRHHTPRRGSRDEGGGRCVQARERSRKAAPRRSRARCARAPPRRRVRDNIIQYIIKCNVVEECAMMACESSARSASPSGEV